MKQIQDIKASVERRKDPAQGAAAAAAGSGEAAAAGRHRSGNSDSAGSAAARGDHGAQGAAGAAEVDGCPGYAHRAQADPTHAHACRPIPLSPSVWVSRGLRSFRSNINTEGAVTDCKIAKSSGSERLDNAACEYVQGPLEVAAPDAGGQARRRHHDGGRRLEPQERSVTTNFNLSAYPRSEKMNFKTLTIAAAIVFMTGLGAVAPASAQNAAPAAPAASAPATPDANAQPAAPAPDANANAATPAPAPADKPSAAASAADQSTPYGLSHIWATGSIVSRGILIVLAVMSARHLVHLLHQVDRPAAHPGSGQDRREEILDLGHPQ